MWDGYGMELDGEYLGSGPNDSVISEGELRKLLFPTAEEQEQWVGGGRVPPLEQQLQYGRRPPPLPTSQEAAQLKDSETITTTKTIVTIDDSTQSNHRSGMRDQFAAFDHIDQDEKLSQQEVSRFLQGWVDDSMVSHGLFYVLPDSEYVRGIFECFDFDLDGNLTLLEFAAFANSVLQKSPLALLVAALDGWQPQRSAHTAIAELAARRAANGQWGEPTAQELAAMLREVAATNQRQHQLPQ